MAYFLFGRLVVIVMLLSLFAVGLLVVAAEPGIDRLGTLDDSLIPLLAAIEERLGDLFHSLALISVSLVGAGILAVPLALMVQTPHGSLFSRLLRFKTALGPVLPTFLIVVLFGLIDRSGLLWPAESIARSSAEARFAFAAAILGFGLVSAIYIAVADWRLGGASPMELASTRIGSVLPGLLVAEGLLVGSGLGARMVGEILSSEPLALGASALLAFAAILVAAMMLDGADRLVRDKLA